MAFNPETAGRVALGLIFLGAVCIGVSHRSTPITPAAGDGIAVVAAARCAENIHGVGLGMPDLQGTPLHTLQITAYQRVPKDGKVTAQA